MKIEVVFTGGTIGSKLNNNVIAPDGSASYQLLSYLPENVNVDAFEPFTTLSEYVTGKHLNMLFNCVNELLKKDYDGIIITHGTDSLQFSAAALGYVFADSKIPIIFVSAQYILDHPESNGKQNFLDAVEFIKEKHGKGVFVCYQNNDKRRYVHLGVRLLQSSPYSDDVLSLCNSYYGEFTEEGFVLNDEINSFESIGQVTLNEYCDSILSIDAKVGVNLSDIPDNTKAIIHGTYHSGTLNTKNQNIFIKATEKDIPVYLTGSSDDVVYESVSSFTKLKLIVLPKISPLAAYIKLWLILDGGLNRELLFKDLGDNIGG